MVRERLFAWDVDRDRRWVRIDEAPFDDAGAEVVLFNGVQLDEEVVINLEIPRRGELPDFLHATSLLMYVSASALGVVRRANVPSARVHPVVLRDSKGKIVRDDFFWVNVMPVVPVVDEHRSVLTRTPSGGIRSVERVVVREENVPDDDLFLCQELALPIIKEPLVRAIESAGLRGATFEDFETLTWPT